MQCTLATKCSDSLPPFTSLTWEGGGPWNAVGSELVYFVKSVVICMTCCSMHLSSRNCRAGRDCLNKKQIE